MISCLIYYTFTLLFFVSISLLANTNIITYIFLSILTVVFIYVNFLQYKNNEKRKENKINQHDDQIIPLVVSEEKIMEEGSKNSPVSLEEIPPLID